jgi:hypothetical protein
LFDYELYHQLVCYPEQVILTMAMAVKEMFSEKNPDTKLSHQIHVQPFNADETRIMRGLNPEGKWGLKYNFGTLSITSLHMVYIKIIVNLERMLKN